MTIPTVEEFYLPLLRVLSTKREPLAARDAIELIADAVKLSDDDRRKRSPGGNKPIYSKRISWAMTHLKRSGHTGSPSFGFWAITDAGERSLAKGNGALADEIADAETVQAEKTGRRDTGRLVRNDPDEIIRTAAEDCKTALAEQLLQRVLAMHPTDFEELVMTVLQKAYGRRPEDVKHTGGQNDGGIDGRLALDRFGLQWAYMQAKRWAGNVGRPEIQQFAGAIGPHRAQQGIFVTSGSYTREAIEFARTSDRHIVLMDGHQLVEAMIDCEVGVTHEVIRLPKIDLDYFAGEA